MNGTKFKAISAGFGHSIALDESDSLWTWGNNGNGQLGNGTTTNSLVPIQIKNGTKFKAISAGSNHSLVIDENDELWGFGYIESGVTKKNNSAVINTPIKVNFNN